MSMKWWHYNNNYNQQPNKKTLLIFIILGENAKWSTWLLFKKKKNTHTHTHSSCGTTTTTFFDHHQKPACPTPLHLHNYCKPIINWPGAQMALHRYIYIFPPNKEKKKSLRHQVLFEPGRRGADAPRWTGIYIYIYIHIMIYMLTCV